MYGCCCDVIAVNTGYGQVNINTEQKISSHDEIGASVLAGTMWKSS
jgi:hypothetical protein